VSVDRSSRVLAAAVRLLPADRAQWGQAMVAELSHLHGGSSRRRFVAGCLRAILLAPRAQDEPGRWLVGVAAAAAVGCAGLLAYGLVQYPGLRTGTGVWVATAACLAVLAAYLLTAVVVVGRLTESHRAVVPLALLGGTTVSALWLLVGVVASSSWISGVLPVVLIPLGSLALGGAAAWRGRSAVAGRQVVLLAALLAGLLLFLGWVGPAVLTGGHPYDPGLVRDFHASGAPDLATYAVDDDLGTGMMLLLLVPLLTWTLGSVGASITAGHRGR
jgi:hypothetical protein